MLPKRPNGNRNTALQGVLSRHVGMGARTCPMLAVPSWECRGMALGWSRAEQQGS